ncbi:MAG: mRNA surveillance protein pelota [Candidatus Aenigmatarchaeota archaeon]
MKSSFDMRHGIGRLKPENADDLWLLSNILKSGDLVTARTLRSVEVRRGEEKEKVGKRPVTLTIKVEKVELNQALRLGGKITEAPPDIPHEWHTIEVGPGDELKVVKEWRRWEIDKIKAAAKAAVPVVVCILDEREADVWLVKERPKHITHIRGIGLAKGEEKSRKNEFYAEITAVLKRQDANYIIIAGPGFEKEDIAKFLKEREKELAKKVAVDSLNHTGEVGLSELIKRRTIEKVAKESRLTEEAGVVEEFFTLLAKGGNVAYGKKEVEKAVEAGAVETLLVSDTKVREFEVLLELAEKMKGKVMIISSEHPSGEKLLGMGGLAAILRYKL